MICYLDKTFCVSLKCTNECGRKLTPKIRKAADAWYRSWAENPEEDGAPISMSCFCGGSLSEVFKQENNNEQNVGEVSEENQ